MNRPEAMNALHPAANAELAEIFDDFAADPSQRVAIITGAGERAFCTGNDMKFTVTAMARSEEHTSELQSQMRNSYAVFCLNKNIHRCNTSHHTQLIPANSTQS